MELAQCMELRKLIINHLKETMGDQLLTNGDVDLIKACVHSAINAHNKEAMTNYTMEQVN
jgi:hypothetical protein